MNALSYICTSRIGGRVDPPVNLPPSPWKTEAMRPDPRPETAPPRGIKGQPRLTQAEITIAAIRECRDEMRAEA